MGRNFSFKSVPFFCPAASDGVAMLCGRVVAKTGKTNLPGNFMSLLRLRLAYHFPPNLVDPGVWLRAFSGKSLRVHRFSALPDLPFSYQLPIRKLFPVRKMGHFPCSLPPLPPPPPPPAVWRRVSLACLLTPIDGRDGVRTSSAPLPPPYLLQRGAVGGGNVSDCCGGVRGR